MKRFCRVSIVLGVMSLFSLVGGCTTSTSPEHVLLGGVTAEFCKDRRYPVCQVHGGRAMKDLHKCGCDSL